MISKIEMKRDSMKLIAEKLRRGDSVEGALDRVIWKQAVKLMTKTMTEAPKIHISTVGRLVP